MGGRVLIVNADWSQKIYFAEMVANATVSKEVGRGQIVLLHDGQELTWQQMPPVKQGVAACVYL